MCCMDWKSDGGTPEDESDVRREDDIEDDIEAIFTDLRGAGLLDNG